MYVLMNIITIVVVLASMVAVLAGTAYLMPLRPGVRIIHKREGYTVSKYMHLHSVWRWRWLAEIVARFV